MSGVLSSAESTSNSVRGKKDKADKAEGFFCKKSFWLLLMKAYRITKLQGSGGLNTFQGKGMYQALFRLYRYPISLGRVLD